MKKTKGYMAGGKTKGMSNGGKLKMTTNEQGKEVPFFAADGAGKMSAGRKVPGTKGYFMGGKTGGKTMARGSGAARPQSFGKNG